MYQFFRRCFIPDDDPLNAETEHVIRQLRRARNDAERLTIIDLFFFGRMRQKAGDELINLAVEMIKKDAGNTKITSLAKRLHISLSQLEKRFRKTVGSSPKKFASIVRFRNIIDLASDRKNMTEIGLDAGYFDQAHFIKDFKSFTGITPEEYFRKNQKPTIFYNHRF